MGNEFEYKEEKKPEKENKDLININYFNYFNSSIKIENNIKFKFIKDNIFFLLNVIMISHLKFWNI